MQHRIVKQVLVRGQVLVGGGVWKKRVASSVPLLYLTFSLLTIQMILPPVVKNDLSSP
jgi:hypothetical protein